ncbi:MAG: hypothetical protein CM15mP32_1810 [Flavobacteriaceae bacterium]|nr:MAG: hypothetical protein CM15mP32_1810 [Flavobacteriaceae bacterium]
MGEGETKMIHHPNPMGPKRGQKNEVSTNRYVWGGTKQFVDILF